MYESQCRPTASPNDHRVIHAVAQHSVEYPVKTLDGGDARRLPPAFFDFGKENPGTDRAGEG